MAKKNTSKAGGAPASREPGQSAGALDTNPNAPPDDSGPGCRIVDEAKVRCRYIKSIASPNWRRRPKDEEDLPESLALAWAEAKIVMILGDKPETATDESAETR